MNGFLAFLIGGTAALSLINFILLLQLQAGSLP